MTNAKELLMRARLKVSDATFHIVSMSHQAWKSVLTQPELSPSMQKPFLIFKDDWEVTLVLEDKDASALELGGIDCEIEKNFRMISFDVDLEFDVVGFMAHIAAVAADAGVSILPFSSFKRDHLLVRQDDLAGLLIAFRDHVAEVC